VDERQAENAFVEITRRLDVVRSDGAVMEALDQVS
jgi:hypothetical protein